LSVLALFVAAIGCEPAEEEPADLSKQVLSANPVKVAHAAPAVDDGLRRAHPLEEMKFSDCLTLGDDGTVTGKKCASGCMMFGPYLSVPTSSDVRLSFDIESDEAVIVGSDIVSQGGSYVHGAVEEQGLEADKKRHIAYRVHFFEPAAMIETRLWIRSDSTTDLELSNFTLEVK
jgi:hypothetical protein